MAKKYQWKTDLTIFSGGYPGEDIGVIGGSTDWTETNVASGSATMQYFYRDALTIDNTNAVSSRVVITATDNWSVSFDGKNNMTVRVDTTINSIVRDDIRNDFGVPFLAEPRHIWVRQFDGGPVYIEASNDDAGTAHTISASPVVMPTYTFTLAPGESAQRSSIYYISTNERYKDLPIPNIYTDVMGVGVHFMNILPKDYRPGASFRTSDNSYLSHNRENGACHIWSGTTWQECRTVGGDEDEKGNAPLILTADNDSSWRNQKLIGKEQ